MQPTYKCRCGTNLIVLDGETKVKCGLCGETSELPAVYWQSAKPQVGGDLAKRDLSPLPDKIEVPDEIKTWNWGAFLLGPIWGVSNGVSMTWFFLVPIVSYFMPFVFGAKGNEWSWKNRRWTSVKQFQSHQRKWSNFGLYLYELIILLFPVRYFITALIMSSR